METNEKMCRICLAKENLRSVFLSIEGELISNKIKFCTDILITRADSFPKHICENCLKEVKIACNVKKKSLETDKLLKGLVEFDENGEEDDESVQMIEEYVQDKLDYEEEEEIIEETTMSKAQSKYLVYEEKPEQVNQPKFYYLPTPSSIKINDTSYFEHNRSLKHFVDGYLQNKPNIEIIKIVNEDCIKEIEKILIKNNGDDTENENFDVEFVEPSSSRSGTSHSKVVSAKRTLQLPSPARPASVSCSQHVTRLSSGAIVRPHISNSRTTIGTSRTGFIPKKNGFVNRK